MPGGRGKEALIFLTTRRNLLAEGLQIGQVLGVRHALARLLGHLDALIG